MELGNKKLDVELHAQIGLIVQRASYGLLVCYIAFTD